jgi:hypothetical protein
LKLVLLKYSQQTNLDFVDSKPHSDALPRSDAKWDVGVWVTLFLCLSREVVWVELLGFLPCLWVAVETLSGDIDVYPFGKAHSFNHNFFITTSQ